MSNDMIDIDNTMDDFEFDDDNFDMSENEESSNIDNSNSNSNDTSDDEEFDFGLIDEMLETEEEIDLTDDLNGEIDLNHEEELTSNEENLEEHISTDNIELDDSNVETAKLGVSSFIDSYGNISVMDTSTEDTGTGFELKYVDIKKIGMSSTRIRKNLGVEALYRSIKSTGLLEPIVVVPTKTEDYYVLVAGYRRLICLAKAGKTLVPCVINKKVKTTEIAIIEAIYNHQKRYSMKETVDYIHSLETEHGIYSAPIIEELLQLDSGDYSKLKDILDDNDPDIVSKLMEGQVSIQQSFKTLETRRKKESREEKENKRAAKAYDENKDDSLSDRTSESGETIDSDGDALSDTEIKDLLGSVENLDDKIASEDLTELVEEGKKMDGYEPRKQDWKHRETLPKEVRDAALARDNNTCQFCKIGGPEYTSVLDEHHKVEVYLGGNDDLDNLVTACTVCHKLIHMYARGELFMRPIEDMDSAEKDKFKRIIYMGNVIRNGMQMKGMKVKQLKEVDNAETIGRTKPGTGQVAT